MALCGTNKVLGYLAIIIGGGLRPPAAYWRLLLLSPADSFCRDRELLSRAGAGGALGAAAG